MRTFRPYRHPAPSGALVLRVVQSGGRPYGFLREVSDEDEPDDIYPTEQKPLEDVLRLLDNKIAERPGAELLVEMEAGIEWSREWGELRE